MTLVTDSFLEDVCVEAIDCGALDLAAGALFVAVGDAASTYDPIASVGLLKALETGIRGAGAVIARLQGDPVPTQEYGVRIRTEHAEFLKQCRLHYALEKRWAGSAFWRERAAATPL